MIRGLTASGKALTKVRHIKIDGRAAVSLVEASGSDQTLKLLIHDRDTLVAIKAVGTPGSDPVFGSDGPLISLWH